MRASRAPKRGFERWVIPTFAKFLRRRRVRRAFFFTLAASAAALLALAACGESAPPDLARGDVTTPIPTSAPVSSATPEPSPSPSATPEPSPTETPAPSATPEPSPTATPSPPVLTARRAPPPDRDLDELARRLKGVTPSGATVSRAAPMSVGETAEFWVALTMDGGARRASATLQAVSENAYWFAEDGAPISRDSLENAARLYEESVRPAVVGAFGDIRNPGLDGDPRLVVLHAFLNGAAGYFGSKDAFSAETHPQSNEREIVYMDAAFAEPGTPIYMSVLAHELQHAIHFNQDVGEESWVNEGLSEVAVAAAGYPLWAADEFARRPDTQLNFWGDEPAANGRYYGAAGAFFAYLAQRLGGYDQLAPLAREPLDGVDGVDKFLRARGLAFEDVFADWTIANYLDADDDERYGYADMDFPDMRRSLGPSLGVLERGKLPQFSARYYVWRGDGADGATIRFKGDETAREVGEDCAVGPTCWWSGRGDGIDAKLTREFDLRGLTDATLEFAIRRDIEDGWDYGYVQASADGGQTWSILTGTLATDDNPNGNAYGDGYTGASGWEGGWERETIDLTPFAGAPVLVRFEYITDDAVYLDGMMIDDISIPQLDFRDEPETPSEWSAEGFYITGAPLAQKFIIQLIEIDDASGEFTVSRLLPDERNQLETRPKGLSDAGKTVALVISPATRGTIHGAEYSVELVDSG